MARYNFKVTHSIVRQSRTGDWASILAHFLDGIDDATDKIAVAIGTKNGWGQITRVNNEADISVEDEGDGVSFRYKAVVNYTAELKTEK